MLAIGSSDENLPVAAFTPTIHEGPPQTFANTERLPLAVALPIIGALSIGAWVLLWKAGQQLLSLVS